MDGRVLQVSVSPGGVPKLPVRSAWVNRLGLEGDRHNEPTLHGGPNRAVALFAIEAINRVKAEGHPIFPGSAGENLTTEGIELSTLPVGTRLAIGDRLVLELSGPDNPCRTIRHSFKDGRSARISILNNPTDSRMYARVIVDGEVKPGDPITVHAPVDSEAERIALLQRVDAADRKCRLTDWRAAAAGGLDIRIVDDGELLFGAAPGVRAWNFNKALGLTDLPNLLAEGLAFLGAQGVEGEVLLDPSDAPNGVRPREWLSFRAARADAVADAPSDGLVIRQIERDETGPWIEAMIAAVEAGPELAAAWRVMAPGLARTAHRDLFVGEVDGRVVATGSLHTHHGVGWLAYAAVIPEARGRGFQKAMIAHRARVASEKGCDVVAAYTDVDSVSARNMEALGMHEVGVRGSYSSTDLARGTDGA